MSTGDFFTFYIMTFSLIMDPDLESVNLVLKNLLFKPFMILFYVS